MQMIIGARGWEHDQWQGSFFEALLPDDWHLKFYASKFGAALAPQEFWLKCNDDEISEFIEDVPEDYAIIFEKLSDKTDIADLTDSANRTNQHFSEEEYDKQTRAKNSIGDWVVFNAKTWQKTGENYHIEQAEIVQKNRLPEKSAVFLVSSSVILKDTEIREIMMAIKTEFKETTDTVYLFFDNELIDIDVMNTAVTLLRMLILL